MSVDRISAAGVPVPRPRGKSQNDYRELALRVRNAGLMNRRYGYYWTKLGAIPFAYAGCIALFLWVGDSWWQAAVAVVFAVLFTQTAFLGHDAAHRQIFRSGRWNDWISLIIGDLFVGMSYGWWQRKHTLHHDNPNKEGSDPDIELPVISFTPEQVQRKRSVPMKWLLAHQGSFFFPILLLEGLSLHASSVRRLCVREPVARRWVEIPFIAVRLGAYLALVLVYLPPGKAAMFLGIQLGLFGFYMGASFAPNHKGMPIVPRGLSLDFLTRQVAMSRNIRGSIALDAAMGGLNYQIEHHLFPSMARPSLRRAAPIVEAFCDEKGSATPSPDCGTPTASCCGTSTASGWASVTRSSVRCWCSGVATDGVCVCVRVRACALRSRGFALRSLPRTTQ